MDDLVSGPETARCNLRVIGYCQGWRGGGGGEAGNDIMLRGRYRSRGKSGGIVLRRRYRSIGTLGLGGIVLQRRYRSRGTKGGIILQRRYRSIGRSGDML